MKQKVKSYVYWSFIGKILKQMNRGPRFDPEPGLMKNLICSSCVCMGFLWILQFHPTSQKRVSLWIGYSKFSLGLNTCDNVSDL